MLTVPLGADAGTPAALLELAVALYESDQISLGRAAEVAGLPYSQMIDELGRRGIPVVRYSVEDLDREVAKAGALGKPVMFDFYADWCVTCKELERYTFSDPAVIAEMDHFVLLKADVTANDADDQALMKHFGIIGPPAILFFDTAGQEIKNYRLVGFKPADAFVEHLRRAVP